MKIRYVILIFVLALVAWFQYDQVELRRNHQNAKQVRLGMTAEKVIQIMGQPEEKNLVIGSRVEAESTFQYKAPFGSSDGIEISFDEQGKVIHVANE
ncbi:MAG: hypothetical protein EP311_08470 [Cytophagales bacterium]|uniref:Uncharacterized protein n=1 Tax=Algoriphagus taiwanensis TaxID=1445656 RepID=A0ABQ6PWH9_9BACT|nr:MAG: hypothetical protein EP311_08470 [Cytophagales bacterium]GMQ31996.1 hypothetical protein Ataiwa_02680 [Algoriphagus taiwanensis]